MRWQAELLLDEQREQWTQLGHILGTRVDREMVEGKSGIAPDPDVVMLSLASALRPEYMEGVKQELTRRASASNAPASAGPGSLDMAAMPVDQFRQIVGGRLPSVEQRQEADGDAARAASEAVRQRLGFPPR